VKKEALIKVRVDLPKSRDGGGEVLWAEPLGGDLYQLRNIPFFAYGLNHLDVVKATAASAEADLEIRQVARASGHRTLRVFFVDEYPKPKRGQLLATLRRHRAVFERGTDVLFAIDVAADGSFDAVYETLLDWENEGILLFETCEPREQGSFDGIGELH
jgi:hypothetical protein